MTTIADHDSYIAAAPEALRPLLTRIRSCLKQALPEAQEIVRYNMPGFAEAGVVIAGYGAFSKQCGLYVSAGAIAACADEIAAAGLKPSKTGVTFSPAKPIPDELVAWLAQAARREV